MNKPILIKVSFENHLGEIHHRRLSLERSGFNFDILKQRICASFCISQPNIKYQDDEGDKITLHSDLELVEALRQLNQSKEILLKLFVTELSPPKEVPRTQQPIEINTKSTNSSPDLHQEPTYHTDKENEQLIIHGIYCDACGFPIIGIRWKCSVCSEINYCESCEQIVNHVEEHPLLRIKVPLPPQPIPDSKESQPAGRTTSVWGEFQQMAQPQVEKATTVAKKLSSEVTQMISTVSEQIKEVGQDLGEKVSQNTSRFIEMCQNLSLSPEAKVPSNDLDCPYTRELALLGEMGFNCRAYMSFLLNKHSGRLDDVLAELLC